MVFLNTLKTVIAQTSTYAPSNLENLSFFILLKTITETLFPQSVIT